VEVREGVLEGISEHATKGCRFDQRRMRSLEIVRLRLRCKTGFAPRRSGVERDRRARRERNAPLNSGEPSGPRSVRSDQFSSSPQKFASIRAIRGQSGCIVWFRPIVSRRNRRRRREYLGSNLRSLRETLASTSVAQRSRPTIQSAQKMEGQPLRVVRCLFFRIPFVTVSAVTSSVRCRRARIA
jgi:hypothetical protein